jgi:hypothetical protein
MCKYCSNELCQKHFDAAAELYGIAEEKHEDKYLTCCQSCVEKFTVDYNRADEDSE